MAHLSIQERMDRTGDYSGEGIADGNATDLYDAVAMIADMGRDGDFRVVNQRGEALWEGSRAEANEWCDHCTPPHSW